MRLLRARALATVALLSGMPLLSSAGCSGSRDGTSFAVSSSASGALTVTMFPCKALTDLIVVNDVGDFPRTPPSPLIKYTSTRRTALPPTFGIHEPIAGFTQDATLSANGGALADLPSRFSIVVRYYGGVDLDNQAIQDAPGEYFYRSRDGRVTQAKTISERLERGCKG